MTPASEPSRIQAELAQRRPFRSRTVEAGAAILRTGDLIRRYLDALLEPEGITWQQYNVLRILRGAGPEGLPTLTVGHRMIERTPGVTRLVDRLLAKGLVSRARGTHDQRQVLCRLTPAGLALLARLDTPVDEADDFMMAPLDDGELGILVEQLDRIRSVITSALPDQRESSPASD